MDAAGIGVHGADLRLGGLHGRSQPRESQLLVTELRHDDQRQVACEALEPLRCLGLADEVRSLVEPADRDLARRVRLELMGLRAKRAVWLQVGP